MIEWAAPGRRVVCITDWPPFTLNQAQKLGARVPMHGQIYEIREAMRSGCSNDDSESILLILCEIINPVVACPCGCGGVGEPAFNVVHFRPVRDTSIECFRGLLAPSPGAPKKVLERA